MKTKTVYLLLLISNLAFADSYIYFYVKSERGNYITQISKWDRDLLRKYSDLTKKSFKEYIQHVQLGQNVGEIQTKILANEEQARTFQESMKGKGYRVVGGDYFRDAMYEYEGKESPEVYLTARYKDTRNIVMEYSKVFHLKYSLNSCLGKVEDADFRLALGSELMKVFPHLSFFSSSFEISFDPSKKKASDLHRKFKKSNVKESPAANDLVEKIISILQKKYDDEKKERLKWFKGHIDFVDKKALRNRSKPKKKSVFDIYK